MAQKGKITITNKQPKGIPPKADFAIYVDFDKDSPRPQRVFQAVSSLITAFQSFDCVVCKTIDSHIEPVMMLEEIELGSLKVWLRNALSSTDDQALKDLDWKPLVGKYLVKAKYLVVEFLNNRIESDDENRRMVQEFSNKLAVIASETDVKHLPDYKPPSLMELTSSLRDISDAKSVLHDTDKLTYISPDEEVSFNLEINWTPEKFDQFLTKEVIKYPAAPMILAVKKPDYLGNSQWELRHGKTSIKAKIKDEVWLEKFQNREVDVRPGDSLRCTVEQEYHYGYDNELLSQLFVITEVTEVLENTYHQKDLLEAIDESKND